MRWCTSFFHAKKRPFFLGLSIVILVMAGGCDAASCGEAANGEACEQSGDCDCGLTCHEGTCVETVSVATYERAVTGDITRYCQKQTALHCAEQTAEMCVEEMARERTKAQEVGCGEAFDEAAACLAQQNLECDAPEGEHAHFVFPQGCTQQVGALETCPGMKEDGADDGPVYSCSGGGSVTEGDSPGCRVRVREGADTLADANCEPTTDGTGWLCTCSAGVHPDARFLVSQSGTDCCDAGQAGLDETCGVALP